MTAPGSLIGFVLVFLFVSWGTSALGALALCIGHNRARRMGCQVERVLAGIVLTGPPILGATVTLVLLTHSFLMQWRPGDDHCLRHLHHAHLCLWHGAAWAHTTWAVVLVISVAMFWITAGLLRGRLLTRSLRSVSWLESQATRSEETELPLVRIPSSIPFCMVVGFRRPRIFLSTQTEALLRPHERAAVLAHEAAHVQQGDLWKRLLLSICAKLGVPGLSDRILQHWDSATERLCDQRAAAAVGDSVAVASALVKLVRAGTIAVAGAAFFGSAVRVDERVRALLHGQPIGAPQSRRLLQAALWIGSVGLFLLVVCSDTTHHLLETLFGLV